MFPGNIHISIGDDVRGWVRLWPRPPPGGLIAAGFGLQAPVGQGQPTRPNVTLGDYREWLAT
jgi:hypothetical protein